MTNTQKFLLKFDTDSEAQASALAAELENTLRAEKIPVERHRENPNSMNLGDLVAFEVPLIFTVHLTALLIMEFITRMKSQVIITRSDGVILRTKVISHKQLAQALEEFLKVTVIPQVSSNPDEENKDQK
jgi:hypothetical protein